MSYRPSKAVLRAFAAYREAYLKWNAARGGTKKRWACADALCGASEDMHAEIVIEADRRAAKRRKP